LDLVRGWPLSTSQIRKKVDSELFAAKVQINLYDILPLDNVLTDYDGTILRQGDAVWIRSATKRIDTIVADNRLAVSTHQDLTAKEAAKKIALGIMLSHLYKWKAFAARVFQYSEDHLDVIYGVVEDKS